MSHRVLLSLELAVTIIMSMFAFVTFSWFNFWLFVASYSITMMAGGIGFHRYLHGSFKCGPVFRTILLSLGTTLTVSTPISWAATHAAHHKYCDTDKDPHTPLKGKLYAFLLWMFDENNLADPKVHARRALNDPVCVWVSKLRWPIVLTGLFIPYALFGFDGLIWGGFLRMFVGGAVVAAVNIWGHNEDVPYGEDRGSDNWLLAVLTFGEGWHKEHHRGDSACARYGLKWYQIDLNWYAILLFERLGLVSNVIRP